MDEKTTSSAVRSIRARIDDNAIQRVTRFFNASLESILGELYQNARRAGATEIHVRTTDGQVEVTDNGRGIADPSVVLAFGRSEWEGHDAEDPAGMGCYSLARHTATITSRTAEQARAWRTTLRPETYRGEEPATVQEVAEETPVGTRVSVLTTETAGAGIATDVARHLEIPVRVNGKKVSQIPFLDKKRLTGTEEHDGVVFGIYETTNQYEIARLRVNFHGHLV